MTVRVAVLLAVALLACLAVGGWATTPVAHQQREQQREAAYWGTHAT